MEDLWSRFGFRGLAFLLLALFALLRIGQLLFNLRMLKRQGLAGSYMAQAIVALVCAGGAFMLCLDPAVLGLEPEAPVPETTASVATVVRTQGLPPNVHFTGPLAPAKEAVQKDDWAALARIIFDDRRKRGGTPDTDFLLQWKAKPLGKEYLDRGRAALKLGEADTAKENLDYAVQLLSDDPEPALLRAETYPEAEWRSALRDLKIAAERAPATDLRAVERRFALLLEHGEKQKALENIDVLVHARPADAQLYWKRGKIRLDVGAIDGAIADLSSAKTALPREPEIRIDLARARLGRDEEEQRKLALTELEAVLKDAPQNVRAIVSRGNALFSLNKNPEAIADYSRALQLEPRNAEAFLGRARVRIQQDQFIVALRDLDEALAIDPKLRGALFWRGYLKRNSDPKTALEDLKRAIEIDSDAAALLAKGECLCNLKRGEEAEAALSDALLLTKDKVLIAHIDAQMVRAKSLRPH